MVHNYLNFLYFCLKHFNKKISIKMRNHGRNYVYVSFIVKYIAIINAIIFKTKKTHYRLLFLYSYYCKYLKYKIKINDIVFLKTNA